MWCLNVSLYVHFLLEVCLGEGRREGEREVCCCFFFSPGVDVGRLQPTRRQYFKHEGNPLASAVWKYYKN